MHMHGLATAGHNVPVLWLACDMLAFLCFSSTLHHCRWVSVVPDAVGSTAVQLAIYPSADVSIHGLCCNADAKGRVAAPCIAVL